MKLQIYTITNTFPKPEIQLKDLRCMSCGKLLAKYDHLTGGDLELKCSNRECANPINRFNFK
jgi:phage FluMu protein Com